MYPYDQGLEIHRCFVQTVSPDRPVAASEQGKDSLGGSIGLPDVTTFRRMLAAYYPVALYYLLRILTCAPPVAVSFTQNAPDENLRFGAGLVVYALALGLMVATAYTILLWSFMTVSHDGIRRRRSVLIVVVVGVIDMVGGLAAITLSGGWGSPFWHAWLSSLVIPCLILGMRWSLVLSLGCIAVLTTALSVTGEGASGSWIVSQRYFYVGAMFTLFLLSGVVGYLGDVCFEVQRRKLDAEATLRNIGTMLEVTRSVAVITTNVNTMLHRVARTIGERHRYDSVGIYLIGPDGREVRLSGWVGNLDDLQRHARNPDHLIHRAIDDMELRFASDGPSWNAAMPIHDGGSILGALLIVSAEPAGSAAATLGLGALVGQIAVGIRVAELRRRSDAAMTDREWELLSGRIHDRITSTMYALVLHLEAYAARAEREANPLAERLAWLHPHGRHLLFYTRQYVYRLLPLMRGEVGLDYVLRHLAGDFERLSGVRVQASISGADGRQSMSSVAICFDTILNRMADVFHGGTASELQIDIGVQDRTIHLSIADDGDTNNDDEMAREGIERIGRLAADVGGDLRVSESQGSGTRIVLEIELQDGSATLDNPADHRRELFFENGSQNGTGV